MTDYYLELENVDFDGDGSVEPIEYHFDLVQSRDDGGNKPFTTVEADQETSNQLLGFQGKSREVVLEWWLYDNGNDKSNGTYNGSGINDSRVSDNTIVTITEQDLYLNDYIHFPEISASWKFYGGKYSDPDGDGTDEGTPVSVVDLSVREVSSNPMRAVGTLRLEVGQVV